MNDTISAVRGHAQALKFVADAGQEFSDLLGAIATAKESERKGPIEIVRFLIDHFVNDDGSHSIPVPGSKFTPGINTPYDKYSTTVKTQDGTKQVPGSWYTDVIKNTAECKAIDTRIGWLNGEEGAPDDIVAMRKTGEEAMERKRLADRKKDMRTALSKGAMLFLHADEIGDINPDRIRVKFPWKTINGVKQVYANTIRLQDPAGECEDKVYSVSEFLRLDLSKLKGDNKDQTVLTIDATTARAPRPPGGKKKDGQQNIAPPTSVPALLNMMNVLSMAIDGMTEQGAKLNSALMAACAAPGQNGDDTIETIGDFAIVVDAIWSTIDKRYNAIKARKAAALNVRKTALA